MRVPSTPPKLARPFDALAWLLLTSVVAACVSITPAVTPGSPGASAASAPPATQTASSGGPSSAPGETPGATTRPTPAGCPGGWRDTSTIDSILEEDVFDLGPTTAWAVGLNGNEGGQRQPAVSHWDGTGWSQITAVSPSDSAGFFSINGTSATDLWAAGYWEDVNLSHPLLEHYDGIAWSLATIPTPSVKASLQSVAALSTTDVWAVGFAAQGDGQPAPYALHGLGGIWSRHDPPSPAGTFGVLSSVSGAPGGLPWAVGYRGSGSKVKPQAIRWAQDAWHSVQLPPVGGSMAFLADIVMHDESDGWAVGARAVGTGMQAIAMHWDGEVWRLLPDLPIDRPIVAMEGVSAPVSGQAIAVGTSFDPTIDDYAPFVARWDGRTWTIQTETSGALGTEFRGVADDPAGTGWVVGRARSSGVRTRQCPDVAGSLLPVIATTEGRTATAVAPPVAQLAHSRVKPLPPVPAVLPGMVARDVTVESGLTHTSLTHGATVADFNGDGWPDVFISDHSRPGRLMINDHGVFHDIADGRFSNIDRHDCASGDVDASGHPDVICVIGASGGTGFKANQVWLDPAQSPSSNTGEEAGVADPLGRGRSVAVFDADDDGDMDIFVGNAVDRRDGLPSPNRLFRNDGQGHFIPARGFGLDQPVGAGCVKHADYDGDGREDLLVCGNLPARAQSAPLILYRGVPGRFRDVTGQVGLAGVHAKDAIFDDFDGDGHLDIALVTGTRVEIYFWRNGAFHRLFRQPIGGIALASGDIDKDGRPDLYIVSGTASRNTHDVVLRNNGDGRHWTQVPIPSTSLGSAEDVVALDYDQNGRTDFLVLNGQREPGPDQLIAFFDAP